LDIESFIIAHSHKRGWWSFIVDDIGSAVRDTSICARLRRAWSSCTSRIRGTEFRSNSALSPNVTTSS
jgi:hypothetical protein